jgi:hypothetical protein
MGTHSLPIWEKRVILVAQEDFSSWKSFASLGRRPLEQASRDFSRGNQSDTSLTTWRRLGTTAVRIDRSIGLPELADWQR